jgi:hypothetical protein
MDKLTLRQRAEKASNKWVKAVRERSGTVPTHPEWNAWVHRWMRDNQRSQSDASGETVDPDGNLAGPEFGDGPEFAGWAERSQPSGEGK